MKRLFLIFLSLAISLVFASCNKPKDDVDETNTEVSEISSETEIASTDDALTFLPLEFTYSSGVGAWSSTFTLNQDGTFSGEYHDSDMGSATTEYPGGILYTCIYSGNFDSIKKVNDYTYSMRLYNLNSRKEFGEEWIEDGRLNIASEPFGLSGGSEFLLYTPDAPISELSEDFLGWWPLRYEKDLEKLNCYGIFNVSESCGFFSF